MWNGLPWVKHVENILNHCGLSYVWQNQSFYSIAWLKNTVKCNLIDQFKQKWYSDLYVSPKGLNYRIFKDTLCIEKYLTILPENFRIIMTKFRCCNHFLPIECGRWTNIPRENRFCNLCETNSIGDEFHFLFECNDNIIKNARRKFIPSYYTIRPNTHKFEKIFNSCDLNLLKRICKFLKIISARVRNPLG